MKSLQVGDIVTRKSYGGDIYFKVAGIKSEGTENICILKGIYYRVQADACESDLIPLSKEEADEYLQKNEAIMREYNY